MLTRISYFQDNFSLTKSYLFIMDVSRNQLNLQSVEVDAKELLNTIKSLMEDYNYDVDDTKYKYKGKDPKLDFVQMLVVGEKKVDNYTKFVISVEAIIEDGTVIKKKRGKVLKGRAKIIFKSELILDYDNKWSKDPILHFLKGIYEKYIYKPVRKDYEVKIAYEMFNIRDDVKKLVKMR